MQDFIEYIESGGKGSQTWSEIDKLYGYSDGYSKLKWGRYQKSKLRLVSETRDKDDVVRSSTHKAIPNENKDLPLLDFEIKSYTTNPYNTRTWDKHFKKPTKLNKEVYQQIIDEIEFKFPVLDYTPKETAEKYIITITDVHIGMSTKGSIYDLQWNLEELYDRLDSVITQCPENVDIELFVLGDYTDGMNKKTARGGHELQQNMNDKQMFKHGLEALTYLVNGLLIKSQGIVEVQWITNSNHPGVMDYIIGETFKRISAQRTDAIKVNILEAFLNGVKVDNKQFVLTHGYDEKFMKRGMPRFLKDVQQLRLSNAMNNFEYKEPIIIRGDQHQYSDIQYDNFRDIMCPALSPPSGWVSTNFMTNYKGGFLIIEPKEMNVRVVPF